MASGSSEPEALFHLAKALSRQDQLEESLVAYRRALEYGSKHHSTLTICDGLGNALARLDPDKYPEAEKMLRRALEGIKETKGDNDLLTVKYTQSLGIFLHQSGQFDESESLLRTAVAVYKKLLPPLHPMLMYSHIAVGMTLFVRKNSKRPLNS